MAKFKFIAVTSLPISGMYSGRLVVMCPIISGESMATSFSMTSCSNQSRYSLAEQPKQQAKTNGPTCHPQKTALRGLPGFMLMDVRWARGQGSLLDMSGSWGGPTDEAKDVFGGSVCGAFATKAYNSTSASKPTLPVHMLPKIPFFLSKTASMYLICILYNFS